MVYIRVENGITTNSRRVEKKSVFIVGGYTHYKCMVCLCCGYVSSHRVSCICTFIYFNNPLQYNFQFIYSEYYICRKIGNNVHYSRGKHVVVHQFYILYFMYENVSVICVYTRHIVWAIFVVTILRHPWSIL